MKLYLLAGLGSFVGGILRFSVAEALRSNVTFHLPAATFIVNIVGSFVIGLVLGFSMKEAIGDEWKVFLAVGVCGGFTTFSAFSFEMFEMIKTGNTLTACLYALASMTVCILAVALALTITK